MQKLGIDLGASAIKIVGLVGDSLKFKYIKSLVSVYGENGQNTVQLNGKTYHFGIGEPLVIRDKTQRKLLVESIILSYYKIFGKTTEETELEVAIGLPINIYLAKNKLKIYKNELKKYENALFNAKVNNEPVVIRLKKIMVCAEGYSTLTTLDSYFNKNNNNIIVDIGYKTTDVLNIEPQDEDSWTISENFTIDRGMWNVFSELKNLLFDMNVDMSEENIEQRLLKNLPITINNNKKSLKELLLQGSISIDYIFNQIELRIPDFRNCDIYLCGGGSIFTYNIINANNKLPNIKLIDNTDKLIYANAIGYLEQLEME